MSSEKRVGDFKLGKTLGEGSFSKVKQGVNVKTGEIFAIKIIDRHVVEEQHMEKQLDREIEIMGKMNHPGLIRLHQVMRSKQNIFLVLDLAQGGELFSKLAQDGPLPENVARSYFQQLIDALDYMHSKRAYHRDLKPENLLLDKQGNLKIADFGLSIMSQSTTDMLKTKCGTPNYVAPEIFTASGYVGAPADIWSAGVILFVMLSASLPFDASTLPELARQIVNVQIRYPSTFPKSAVDLMKHIIVRNPEDRYTIEEIKNHPWFLENYHPLAAGEDAVCQDVSVEGETNEPTINAFELIARIGTVNMDRLVDNQKPVNAATTFSTTKPFNEIKRIILETFHDLSVPEDKISFDEAKKSFKAQIPMAYKEVGVTIEIAAVPGGTFLVEFGRRSGTPFDFLRVYRTMKTRLTS